MKKLLALLLTLSLLLSLAACVVIGDEKPGGGDGTTGDGGNQPEYTDTAEVIAGVLPEREAVTDEGVTHSDPALAAFLREKVTFLSKVYPDGNLPENFVGQYKLIVELVYRNTYYETLSGTDYSFNELSMDNQPAELDQADMHMSAIADQLNDLLYPDGNKHFKHNFEKIWTECAGYAEFEDELLPGLAALEENIPEEINLYLVESNKDIHACRKCLALYSGELSAELIEAIQSSASEETRMQNTELSGNTDGAVLSVVKALLETETESSFDDVSFCSCGALTRNYFAIVSAEEIYPEESGDYDYIIIHTSEGQDLKSVDLKTVGIADGKLYVEASFSNTDSFIDIGDNYFIIKLDRSKLTSPITEVVLVKNKR